MVTLVEEVQALVSSVVALLGHPHREVDRGRRVIDDMIGQQASKDLVDVMVVASDADVPSSDAERARGRPAQAVDDGQSRTGGYLQVGPGRRAGGGRHLRHLARHALQKVHPSEGPDDVDHLGS